MHRPEAGSLAESIAEIRYALMRELPFFGHLLLNAPLRLDARGSLVVTNDGPIGTLHLDPEFAAGLPRGALAMLLLHGVLHLAFGYFQRRQGRQEDLWNQAHDFAINQILDEVRSNNPRMGLEWPPEKLLSPKWKGLTAEAIYDRLVHERLLARPKEPPQKHRKGMEGPPDREDCKANQESSGSSGGSPPAAPGTADPYAHGVSGDSSGGAVEGAADSSPREAPQGTGLESPSTNPANHREGGPGKDGPIRPRSSGRGYQDATDCVHARSRDASPDAQSLAATLQDRALRNLLAEAMTVHQERGVGTLPGAIAECVDLALRPAVPWVEPFLQRMQGRLRGGALSYARPSRRSLALGEEGVLLPGRTRRMPRVAVILDTSGSMAVSDLAEFLGTVRHIAEALSAEIRLIQVDAAIQSDTLVDDFDLALGQPFQLLGRGGTRFDKLPERLSDEAFEPVDLAILFTDGMPDSWPTPEAWTTEVLVITTFEMPPDGYQAIRFTPSQGAAPRSH